MTEIKLTNEQMKELQTEFDKLAVAWEKGKTGILFMQIWPDSALARGHFLPEKVSIEMINVMNKYEKEIKEAFENGNNRFDERASESAGAITGNSGRALWGW